MDYGNRPQGTPIAPIAIGSLNGALAQMKTIIPTLTDEQAWRCWAPRPTSVKNDDTEVFTLADAQTRPTLPSRRSSG